MNRGVNITYLPGTLSSRFQHDVYCVCQASRAKDLIVLVKIVNRPNQLTITPRHAQPFFAHSEILTAQKLTLA